MPIRKNILYLYETVPSTAVEGPGRRFALWTQGCSRRCEGCHLPQTWEFGAGNPVPVDELVAAILSDRQTEGITVLGGEPLDQPEAVLRLVSEVSRAGKSVMLFTGYDTRTLSDPGRLAVLSHVDLLIDGPYIQAMRDFSRPWVGSSNQRIVFRTDRYRALENNLGQFLHQVEIRIRPRGEVRINGMMPLDVIDQLIGGIGIGPEFDE